VRCGTFADEMDADVFQEFFSTGLLALRGDRSDHDN
jgi:hypothetical protein